MAHLLRRRIFIALLLWLPPLIAAPDVDALFQTARQKAFAGELDAARSIARDILWTAPGYHDAAILIARTFAWGEQYPAARAQLHRVIRRAPGYLDAYSALVDTELWSGHSGTALWVARQGLEHAPDSAVLLYKKAQALAALNRNRAATRVLRSVLRIDPKQEQAAKMLADLDAAPEASADDH